MAKAPECIDCGATMQEFRYMLHPFWRCPWAKPGSWRLSTHLVVGEIYCGGKPYTRKIVGGMSAHSVG